MSTMNLQLPSLVSAAEYGVNEQLMFGAAIYKLSGYQILTTFFRDFSIAEFCECYMNDKGAIRKTYERAKKIKRYDYEKINFTGGREYPFQSY